MDKSQSISSRAIDRELDKIEDDALRARLTSLVNELRDTREFGLVFEKHLPEEIRLPLEPIEREALVGLRDSVQHKWRIVGFKDKRKTAVLIDRDGHETERATSELVVIREFGEVVYPGFELVDTIQSGSTDHRHHIVINGENFHVLQALDATHASSIDLIYIDPPYNTGSDSWIYNDKYVDAKDLSSSSKWLSFMERRLDLAHDLLKDTGVIIVAIGDDEQHRLRMLLDQVFGRKNFISNVVWQGGRKNDSRFVSNGADYMLIYARNLDSWVVAGVSTKQAPNVSSLLSSEIKAQGARWRDLKPGIDEALETARAIWQETNGDHSESTKRWRSWMKDFKKRSGVTDAVSRYTSLDELTGEPIFTGQNISWPGGGGPRYDLAHPVTGKPVRVPKTGWRYTHDDMLRLIAERRVRFGADETSGVQGISYLSEMDTWVAGSVFDVDRRKAPVYLETILGDQRFPYPKDHEVLMRWIRLAAPKDAVVLDFFGGSGTTTEAVLRLNADDGGTRQSILVTNNEVSKTDARRLRKDGHHPGDQEWDERGVFEYVTRPRISTVVKGTRTDGSKYSDGIAANVSFYNLRYLNRDRIDFGMEFEPVSPLLWMQAGAIGPIIKAVHPNGYAITRGYAVLFDVDKTEPFISALAETHPQPSTVFVVTDSDQSYRSVSARLPRRGGPRLVRLYEDYLSNFEINTDNRF